MPASGYLQTVFTGTILATGKTFTHGLGTTPDMIYFMTVTSTLLGPMFVVTFGATTVTVGGIVDAAPFTCLVQRIHSITG